MAGLSRGKKWALGLLLLAGIVIGVGATVRQAEVRVASPRGLSPGLRPLAVAGPQTWTIGGRAVRVSSTYHLVMPRTDGTPAVMFVAELINEDPAITTENVAARGDAAAVPLMQHVVRERLHERVPIGTADGRTTLDVEWVGIVFLMEAGAFSNSGYRTRSGHRWATAPRTTQAAVPERHDATAGRWRSQPVLGPTNSRTRGCPAPRSALSTSTTVA